MRSGLRALRRWMAGQPRGRKPLAVRPFLEVLEDRCLLSAPANFVQTNLVSNVPGTASTTDPNLVNPWGLAAGGTQGPFWVANDGTGTSTLYNGQGVPVSPGNNPSSTPLVVNVPGSNSVNGKPTGVVFNSSGTGFNVSEGTASGSSTFIFDGLDGTISGWNSTVNKTNAIVEVTQPGAVFTGLAIGTGPQGQTLLYAADNKNGVIDVYNQNWQQVTTLPGNFTDSRLPTGFSPFNIQNINGKLYVEYASSSSGIVDVYNTDGTLDTQVGQGGRLITGGPLDRPWGVAMAPSDFGSLSNDLLVGNFGNGNINAFNPQTGKFVGELMTSSGQPFQEDHLWSLQFGNGGIAGPTSTLFFTAGIDGEKNGLFGSLQAEPIVAPGTVVPHLGNSVQQTVTTVPANGDVNPYGVAFVPQGFPTGGKLQPGDILVSNFNDSANVQGTGSTIEQINPDGSHSLFFQGQPGLGLNTALGILPQGFVIVGNTPATVQNGTPTVQNGSLLILDSNGNQVGAISSPNLLQGPWDLAINNVSRTESQVFVSNVLSGTVTRIDLTIPAGGTPQVESETQIASGFAHTTNSSALVLGPTGLAFNPDNGTLYVASTADNAIFAIPHAAITTTDHGTGKLVTSDPTHLNGPLGLVLASNGDLIVANGDAFNPSSSVPTNLLLEFKPNGQFVGQFQVDSGSGGGAFGLGVQTVGKQVRLAAVDDNTNTLHIFTFDPPAQSDSEQDQSGSMSEREADSIGSSSSSVQSSNGGQGQTSSTSGQSSSHGRTSALDQVFQAFNAALASLESQLVALDPQLAAMIETFNMTLEAQETHLAGHPIGGLPTSV
jgi:uncharacterized protein (TIGR03118 family)